MKIRYWILLGFFLGFLFGIIFGMLLQNMIFMENISSFFNGIRIENFSLNLDFNQTKFIEDLYRYK